MSINPAGTALYVSSIDAAEGNWGWKTYSFREPFNIGVLGLLLTGFAQIGQRTILGIASRIGEMNPFLPAPLEWSNVRFQTEH
jgi:hypothetical protein